MNSLSRIAALGAMVSLAGCGSSPRYPPPPYPGSSNPDILVVGEQPPPGYPIMSNVHVGNYCTEVTESWTPSIDPASGMKIWLKQVSRVPARVSESGSAGSAAGDSSSVNA